VKAPHFRAAVGTAGVMALLAAHLAAAGAASMTARGLALLMQKLANGKAVNARADAEMVAILERQKFKDAIPAGVPEGTPIAHKTGTITKIHHDAAIVYGPRPYVLVILVRGIQEQKESAALMAAISREVWNSLEK